MGTNYYLQRPAPVCDMCGRYCGLVRERHWLHIGKSSAGWFFSLRVYPQHGDDRLAPFGVKRIRELADWRPLLKRHEIVDEYGDGITPAAMIYTIAERSHPARLCSHFISDERFPRWILDRVRPGAEGTYDLCNYEFN